MTHPESTPESLADGYYWAQFRDVMNGGWFPIRVKTKAGNTFAVWCGNAIRYPLSDFTFGPRIEEPNTPPPASS